MRKWTPLHPFALVLLAWLPACGGDPAPDDESPRWRVKSGFVRAPDGRRAILRGANLAGMHKVAPYFSFHQPADYVRLREDWGMTAIRFLVVWAAVEPHEGEYDDAYLDEVALRVGWARDAGLHVVLDMHQDVYGEGFATGGGDGAPRWACDEANYQSFTPAPEWYLNYLDPSVIACVDGFFASDELQQHYIEAWRRLASRLRDNVAVVGFDPMNEPHWGSAGMGSFEASRLQPFYEKLVPAVREVAPQWLAFLEPGASRNLGVPTSLSPFPFGDVVYSPHSYNPAAEQGKGFDPASRDALIDNIALLAEEARALDAALWIGEYGGKATAPGITEYMDASYEGAGAVAAASAYWSYDANTSGYAMLHDDRSPKPKLQDVLIRPAPEWVAGDPISWEFEESSRKFTLSWTVDPSVSAPTVIVVPVSVYPSGYMVSCDGCETEQLPGSVAVVVPPRGDPAVVEVTPK